MKCKCVYCGIIIDVKGIDPQNQKCKVCKEFEKKIKHSKESKRLLNSLYGKKSMNRYTMNKISQLKKQHQDKISFTIEQLEKLKRKIQHNILFVKGDDYLNVVEEIDNQIDDQINELMEMK